MKELAIRIAKSSKDPTERLNLLREYVQACVLRSLHESEAFVSLEQPAEYAPVEWLKKLSRDLGFMGFDAGVTWNDRKTVHVGWVRIAGLLSECGLADASGAKLSVKLEVDTRPPAGAVIEQTVVNRHFLFALAHHDLPSLCAGKIHAVGVRSFPKGRDWYDFVWYRSRRPPVEPNRSLLEAAFAQSGRTGGGSEPSEPDSVHAANTRAHAPPFAVEDRPSWAPFPHAHRAAA